MDVIQYQRDSMANPLREHVVQDGNAPTVLLVALHVKVVVKNTAVWKDRQSEKFCTERALDRTGSHTQ